MKTIISRLALICLLASPTMAATAQFNQMGTFYFNSDHPAGTPLTELITEWGYPDGAALSAAPPHYYPLQGNPYATLPNGTQLWSYQPISSLGLPVGWHFSPDLQAYGVPASAKAVLLLIKVKAKTQNVAPFDLTNLGQIQLSIAAPDYLGSTNEVVHAHAEKPPSATESEGRSNLAIDSNTITVPVGVAMVNNELVFAMYTNVVGTPNATINRAVYLTGYWD